MSARPRAADEFLVIRARMEELRRERGAGSSLRPQGSPAGDHPVFLWAVPVFVSDFGTFAEEAFVERVRQSLAGRPEIASVRDMHAVAGIHPLGLLGIFKTRVVAAKVHEYFRTKHGLTFS